MESSIYMVPNSLSCYIVLLSTRILLSPQFITKGGFVVEGGQAKAAAIAAILFFGWSFYQFGLKPLFKRNISYLKRVVFFLLFGFILVFFAHISETIHPLFFQLAVISVCIIISRLIKIGLTGEESAH